MSSTLLSNFMRFALDKTGADRALVTDNELAIVDMVNLEQSDIMAETFLGIETIRQALDSGEPIITNNAVSSISNAPLTNTSFSNLRVVVVIPIAELGAIYLDQPIRNGIIPKETIDRLMAVGMHLADEEQVDLSEGQLGELYHQVG